jgi:integrase
MASLEGAEQRWTKRLQPFFGGLRAVNVTTPLLERYVEKCLEQGLAAATVNRDLASLRRALNLAVQAGTLPKVPSFPHLAEAAPRSGFVEESQYQKLAQGARELWLRALLATAYTFGLRKGELLNLRVRQFDRVARTIRLNAGETKSGEGRVIKLTQDVYTLLQACVSGKNAEDFIFTRPDGKKVLDFRQRWDSLTESAGLPGLLFHDLRRSAVRNMTRRGIIESVAMKISGHETRNVFERYNIVSESDLADAALKIEAGQFGHTLGILGAENGIPSAPVADPKSAIN